MLGFGGSGDMEMFRDWVTAIMAGLAPIPEARTAGIAAKDAFAAHIARSFPTARHLREYLETFSWRF